MYGLDYTNIEATYAVLFIFVYFVTIVKFIKALDWDCPWPKCITFKKLN